MRPHFVEFYASSPKRLRAQATAAVNETLRQGSTTLVVGLDSLSILDDAAISGTIVALRGLREIGGTVRLVTQSVAHRRHIEAIGLDRIFDVFSSFDEAGRRDEQRDSSFLSPLLVARITRVLVGSLLFVALLLQPVTAQEDAPAASVVRSSQSMTHRFREVGLQRAMFFVSFADVGRFAYVE